MFFKIFRNLCSLILFITLVSCAKWGQSTKESSRVEITNDCINDFLGSCIIRQDNKAAIEPNLIASNIALGVSIFGVTGTYSGSSGLGSLASNMHRDPSTTQMLIQTESIANAGIQYLNSDPGYRAIPRINKDDDGHTGGSVTYVDRSTWAATTCGTTQSTVELRIADCATVFGANATWDGSAKGNAGQSIWNLVTRTGDRTNNMGREVWRDQRTGLLWSSLVSINLNWCKASGSNNISGNPAAEDDLSNYCDNALYQNLGGLAVSACFEDESIHFTDIDANIDNGGKAGLSISSVPTVSWRLPTLFDQQQANIDGIRFVLPEYGPNGTGWEWSSTTQSGSWNRAWRFFSAMGSFNFADRNINSSVRCVGR